MDVVVAIVYILYIQWSRWYRKSFRMGLPKRQDRHAPNGRLKRPTLLVYAVCSGIARDMVHKMIIPIPMPNANVNVILQNDVPGTSTEQ